MTTIQPPAPIAVSRPDFDNMTVRELRAFLSAKSTYVSNEDLIDTRLEKVATANLAYDRSAEDFAVAKEQAQLLNQAVDEASAALQAYPKGPTGLTSDEVKKSAEWIAAHRKFDQAFQALRNFNSTYTKVFQFELRQERDAQRNARLHTAI
jgi:hypothetical protein